MMLPVLLLGALSLDWRAPSGCPDQQRVLAAIERAAGDAALASALRVEVTVEAISGGGFRAHLVMRGALDAERTLEGESCDAIADTGAWLIAQALRGVSSSQSAGPRPSADSARAQPLATEALPKAADEPRPTANRASSDVQTTRESDDVARPSTPAGNASETEAAGARSAGSTHRLVFELGPAMLVDTGALPAASFAAGVDLALRMQRLRLALRPRVFLPQSTSARVSAPGAQARIGLAELPLQACYDVLEVGVRFGPCAAAAFGMAWGTGEHFAGARSASGPWLALEAGVGGAFPLGRAELRAELALARPLWKPRFSVAGATVDRAADLLVRAGLSGSWRF